jgi:hypothetical protein
MSDTKEDIYFSLKGGRQRQVSKREWEQEWLSWWERTNRADRDASDESKS